MYKYILFDLDGTITDSSKGITNCVKYALEAARWEIPENDRLLEFIGPPLTEGFMTISKMSEKEAEAATAKFRERYNVTGLFENEPYELIFNRDILISESSAIADCRNSMGVISNETIVANHPWVDDVQGELDRLAAEKEANLDLYGGFGQNVPPGDEPPDDKNE